MVDTAVVAPVRGTVEGDREAGAWVEVVLMVELGEREGGVASSPQEVAAVLAGVAMGEVDLVRVEAFWVVGEEEKVQAGGERAAEGPREVEEVLDPFTLQPNLHVVKQ